MGDTSNWITISPTIPHIDPALLLPEKILVSSEGGAANFSSPSYSGFGIKEIWIEILAQLAAAASSQRAKQGSDHIKSGFLIKVKKFRFHQIGYGPQEELHFAVQQTSQLGPFMTVYGKVSSASTDGETKILAEGELQFSLQD